MVARKWQPSPNSHHTSFELEGMKCGVATPHFIPSNSKEVWCSFKCGVVMNWGKKCGVVKRSVVWIWRRLSLTGHCILILWLSYISRDMLLAVGPIYHSSGPDIMAYSPGCKSSDTQCSLEFPYITHVWLVNDYSTTESMQYRLQNAEENAE